MRRFVVLVCLAATAVFGVGTPALADTTKLQHRVDEYLASIPGSRQVAANRIAIPGGELTLGAKRGCSREWLCLWKYDNGFDSVSYFVCGTYPLRNWIGWGGLENNQTTGTVARFENRAQETLFTSTAYEFRDTPRFDGVYWTPVWYVTPC
ncbi:hypothetical protein ACWEGE_41720 [Amycolatopsis sp. NPDC004747]